MSDIKKRLKELEGYLKELPQSDAYADEAMDIQDEIDEIKKTKKLTKNPVPIRDMSMTGWK